MRWSGRMRNATWGLFLALAGCRGPEPLDLPEAIVLPPAEVRVERWREDLRVLAEELEWRHVDPFRVVDEQTFDRSIEALDARIPELDDTSVVIEMARIAASIGDGHTGFFLHGPRLGLRPGPFWFLWLEDGIYAKGVVGNVGADVLNWRLVRVGGVAPDEAVSRVAPYIPRDNEMGLLEGAPSHLNLPALLQAVGLGDADGRVTYGFEDADGERREVTVRALPEDQPVVFLVKYAEPGIQAPLAERLRHEAYAFERLGDVVYLQYNACRDRGLFRELCQAMRKEIEAAKTDALVVDLRRNVGGYSLINRELYAVLDACRDLRGSRLRVLIGRTTFSSGMWAAVDLASDYDARLYGEPTGGTPNAPGERGRFALPNSTLDCGYSRRMWRRGGDRYNEAALPPDVFVGESAADHFAGRDPVLEAALRGD